MKLFIAVFALFLFGFGCAVTDVKDNSCAASDAFETEQGDIYCLDEAAPAQCEHVVDEIIDAFVTCSDGAFTEDELLDELEQEGVSFSCDEAVATSTEFDTCIEQLQDPECEGDLAVISEECQGSVFVEQAAR